MPLPASTWAAQIGRSAPSQRWPFSDLGSSSETADTDPGDDLIPATQASSRPEVSPNQRFKSLSHLTDAINPSPRSLDSNFKALRSIHLPTLTQKAQDPVAALPRSTQPLTSNALHFNLQYDPEVTSSSSSSDEHVHATKTQTATAPLPRLPSNSLTPQTLDRPAPLECKSPDQPAIPARTGSVTLDDFLAKEISGFQPGGAIELIGPTASAKSQWAVQIALRVRATALRSSTHQQPNSAPSSPTTDTADDQQILIIDTEGALTSQTVQGIASALAQEPDQEHIDIHQLLSGVRLIHALTVAELIATLRILQSPYRHSEQAGVPFIHHIAAVVLDSTSYHLRSPPDINNAASSDRTTRRYLLSILADLHDNLTSLNPHLRLIATTQMALKMFTSQGQLVNYRVPDSVAWLVPQVGNEVPSSQQDHTDYRSPLAAWSGNRINSSSSLLTSRGPGILGPAATRLVLFRGVSKDDFGQRWAHVIFHAAQDDNNIPPQSLTIPLCFSLRDVIVEDPR